MVYLRHPNIYVRINLFVCSELIEEIGRFPNVIVGI